MTVSTRRPHRKKNYTQEEVTRGLLALVTWAGSAAAAASALRAEGYEIQTQTLARWKATYADEYNRLREKHGGDLERYLVLEMREQIMRTHEAQRLAVEKAVSRLKKGEDPDPAKTAHYLTGSKDKDVNKILALTGRPEKITENRNPQEIVRALEQLGVIKKPALEQGDGES